MLVVMNLHYLLSIKLTPSINFNFPKIDNFDLKEEFKKLEVSLKEFYEVQCTKSIENISSFCKISSKTVNKTINPEDAEFIDNLVSHNDEALNKLLQISNNKEGWQFVNLKDVVTVEKCYLPPGLFVRKVDAAKGSKHACIKSSGIINAPPESVFNLFLDNSRVREYNEHCIEIKDAVFS